MIAVFQVRKRRNLFVESAHNLSEREEQGVDLWVLGRCGSLATAASSWRAAYGFHAVMPEGIRAHFSSAGPSRT